MGNEFRQIDRFLQDWSEEFARAIEMFSGEVATVTCTSVAVSHPASLIKPEDYLWWKQEFEGDGAFTTWVGATEPAWSILGSAMAGEGDDSARQIYIEMLGQAQQGAATLLSGRLGKQVRCLDGQFESEAELASLSISEVKINFRGQELPPLLYGIDPAFSRVSSASETLPQKYAEQGESKFDSSEHSYSPMLERLMDLELPLSVALGRAVMPIQEILKMTSGSLIELDRVVGDYVELLVHGTVVARGEVVALRGNYGVRIKEIISRKDRIALHEL